MIVGKSRSRCSMYKVFHTYYACDMDKLDDEKQNRILDVIFNKKK